MATDDVIGFSGADPQGLGARAGGPDKPRKMDPVLRRVLQTTIDREAGLIQGPDAIKSNEGTLGPQPQAALNLEARVARLEALYITPGQGHNARAQLGAKKMVIDLNLIPPDSQGAAFVPRCIIFDYTPPTPDGPNVDDIATAIALAYTSWPLIPQALDFLACDGLNYLVFPDQNFFGTIGADDWSIIFFVVGGVTYTAFSIGGAYVNGDGF